MLLMMNEVDLHHHEFRFALLDHDNYPDWHHEEYGSASNHYHESFYSKSVDIENNENLNISARELPLSPSKTFTVVNQLETHRQDTHSHSRKDNDRRWHYGSKDVSLAAACPSQSHMLSTLGLLPPEKEKSGAKSPGLCIRSSQKPKRKRTLSRSLHQKQHKAADHLPILHVPPSQLFLMRSNDRCHQPDPATPAQLSSSSTDMITNSTNPTADHICNNHHHHERREDFHPMGWNKTVPVTSIDEDELVKLITESPHMDHRIPTNVPSTEGSNEPLLTFTEMIELSPLQAPASSDELFHPTDHQDITMPSITTNLREQESQPATIPKPKPTPPSNNPISNFAANLGFEESTCLICGDFARWQHYGVLACEGCKGFFKRAVRTHFNFKCAHGEKCRISKQNRTSCPRCRYLKCIRLGMAANHAKGRRRTRKQPPAYPSELSFRPNTNFELGIESVESHVDMVQFPSQVTPVFAENTNMGPNINQAMQCYHHQQPQENDDFFVVENYSPALWNNGVVR